MTGLPPVPTEYDPAADGLPEVLDPSRLPEGGAGRVVTLLSTAEGSEGGWARDSVVALAKAWADDGVRVFLADLGLGSPALHHTLGVPNEEGVTDMFRFGASVQRVAHRVGDLPFFFTSAGSPTYSSREVLQSDRWEVLVEGFAEAGAALLLYLPWDEPGAEAILARTSEVVLLGDEIPEDLLDATGRGAYAWIGSPGAAARIRGGAASPPRGSAKDPSAPDDASASPASAEAEWSTGWESDLGWAEADVDPVPPAADDADPTWGEEATWDLDPETADTQTFEVSPPSDDSPDANPTHPTPEESEGAGGAWEDLAPGLEIDPALSGSMGDFSIVDEAEGFGGAAAQKSGGEPLEAHAPPTEITPKPGPPEYAAPGGDAQAFQASSTEEPPRPAGAEIEGGDGGLRDHTGGRAHRAPTPGTGGPRRRRWLVWGGAAAVLALGAWQLMGSGLLPGAGAGGAGGEPPAPGGGAVSEEAPSPGATETTPAAPDVDPGEPTSPLLGASLVIQSFPDGGEAQEFADRLSESLGELLFVVVPSAANGQTWYRTVAGPARDVAEIPGIQERIERAGLPILAGRTGWFPRRTGLAFLLTEELTVDAADALARRYKDEGIPAYVLAIDYSAGVRRYRVYAGGYAFEGEAAPLARLLTEAGIDAPLVPRLGSMPSGR